VDYRAK
jgi:hypothetical protein